MLDILLSHWKLIFLLVAIYFTVTILFPPLSFPRNIPTIPFYVSFLGLFTQMDQKDIYEKYLRESLEKYGAVKIYFASRWNILVTKPEYLQQVFRDETTFAKSGNHEKIPYAVISDYTGDNVISAHGEVWKLYRSVITQGIQFPSVEVVEKNSNKFVRLIDKMIGDKNRNMVIPVADVLQRLTLANIGESMLGVDFKTLDQLANSELHSRLKMVKSQIFKPLYLNFPFLDKFPIASRVKAREEVKLFRKYFTDEVLKAQRTQPDYHSAGYQLVQALDARIISEKQFMDNAVIILVAGHENPQLLFTSLLYVLAKHPEVQTQLRLELKAIANVKQLDNLPYLSSVLYETLRMFPPLGNLINRKTSKDVILGSDIRIPKGVYVGYNNFATGRDSNVWENANEFKPERWGIELNEIQRTYKHSKSAATFAAFHGGRRACLGEKFALYESKVFLYKLLLNFQVSLDLNWEDKLTLAGPVCPFLLRINFTKLDDKT